MTLDHPEGEGRAVTDNNPIMALPPALRGQVMAYVSAKVEDAEKETAAAKAQGERDRRSYVYANKHAIGLRERLRSCEKDFDELNDYVDYLADRLSMHGIRFKSFFEYEDHSDEKDCREYQYPV